MRFNNSWVERNLFFIAIGGHLIAEAIRRFIWYSSVPYFLADVILVGSAIFFAMRNGFKIQLAFITLSALYIFFGIASLGIEGESIFLLIPGLRPLILGFAMYVVSSVYFRKYDDAQDRVVYIFGLITLFVLLIAFVQLLAGVDSSINQLPAQAGVEGGGRGDYGASGVFVENLFRPTSIFMHTGRLGQYAFISALLPLMILISEKSSKSILIYTIFGLFLVIISGQRAAAIFIFLGALLVAIYSRRAALIFRLLIVVVSLLVIGFFLNENLRYVIFGRLMSGFSDASARVSENTGDTFAIFHNFFFHGKGIGFFSFGGSAFGGEIFYDYMRKYVSGNLENGWFRILGETGFGGLVAFFAMFFILITNVIYRLQRTPSKEGRALHYCALITLFALVLWNLTHDVFANYLIIINLFMFIGASEGKWLRRRNNYFIKTNIHSD